MPLLEGFEQCSNKEHALWINLPSPAWRAEEVGTFPHSAPRKRASLAIKPLSVTAGGAKSAKQRPLR